MSFTELFSSPLSGVDPVMNAIFASDYQTLKLIKNVITRSNIFSRTTRARLFSLPFCLGPSV
jgi:hypothetical protein